MRANPAAEHPAITSAKRRRAALNKLKRSEPFPLAAPLLGDRFKVLVHKSTKKTGWWQATFFDADGLPYGDSEARDWAQLLEHIHGDSVDWTRARRANPTAKEQRSMKWFAHRSKMRASKQREQQARKKRERDLAALRRGCDKRRRKRITMCRTDRERIRQIARDAVSREKAFRKDARESYRYDAKRHRTRMAKARPRYSKAESDSLAIHNIPSDLVQLFGELAHNFPVSLAPDHRAELFLEWVEEHPDEVAAYKAQTFDVTDAELAAAYAAQHEEAVPF